jgi:deoxyhypusine synthase
MSDFKDEINKGIPANVIENIYHTKGDIDLSDRIRVRGYDFNQGIDYEAIWKTMKSVGAQSTNLAHAMDIINEMINWRLSDDPVEEEEEEDYKDPEVRANTRCMIFVGYTSNMISMGTREYIRYLCQHRMIDCIVTTCGGIEEDFIKCMGDLHVGAFDLDGSMLRDNSIN